MKDLNKRFPGLAKSIVNRFGMIENIDENFGELMAKLDEWGVLENTLVIFTTDNGAQVADGSEKAPWNNNYKTGKGSPGEGGTHVPCFWYLKGKLKENKDIKALSSNIDLYKSFCDLVGVTIPNTVQQLDGRSLLPVLNNPELLWKDDRMLFIHSGRWGKGEVPEKDARWAVRSQKWRLVQGKLYDIENDPKENNDVSKKYPEVYSKIRGSYLKWWDETLPLMVNENRVYKDSEPPLVKLYEKQKAAQGIPNWKPLAK